MGQCFQRLRPILTRTLTCPLQAHFLMADARERAPIFASSLESPARPLPPVLAAGSVAPASRINPAPSLALRPRFAVPDANAPRACPGLRKGRTGRPPGQGGNDDHTYPNHSRPEPQDRARTACDVPERCKRFRERAMLRARAGSRTANARKYPALPCRQNSPAIGRGSRASNPRRVGRWGASDASRESEISPMVSGEQERSTRLAMQRPHVALVRKARCRSRASAGGSQQGAARTL